MCKKSLVFIAPEIYITICVQLLFIPEIISKTFHYSLSLLKIALMKILIIVQMIVIDFSSKLCSSAVIFLLVYLILY